MKGAKPVPTAIKRLTGNPGKRPLNETEPQHEAPGVEFDDPPAELANDPAASAEWRRLVPMLRKAKQITEAERSSLVALCREWSRYLAAGENVSKLGMVVKAPSGYPIVNPYLSIGNKALVHCSKLWAELGLTPSSRSRIHTIGGSMDDSDPFSEFDAPQMDEPPAFDADDEDDGNRTH